MRIKEEYLKLKDLFDKVYDDNLVLIEYHEESKKYLEVIKKQEERIKGLENSVKVY